MDLQWTCWIGEPEASRSRMIVDNLLGLPARAQALPGLRRRAASVCDQLAVIRILLGHKGGFSPLTVDKKVPLGMEWLAK